MLERGNAPFFILAIIKMIKKSQIITLAGLFIIAALIVAREGPLYADQDGLKERLEEAFSIIEAGSTEEDSGKVLSAVEKYASAYNILASIKKEFPDNKRAQLLMDLTKSRVKECRSRMEEAISNIDANILPGEEKAETMERAAPLASAPAEKRKDAVLEDAGSVSEDEEGVMEEAIEEPAPIPTGGRGEHMARAEEYRARAEEYRAKAYEHMALAEEHRARAEEYRSTGERRGFRVVGQRAIPVERAIKRIERRPSFIQEWMARPRPMRKARRVEEWPKPAPRAKIAVR